ncbi:MAG TPA: phytanoyl-CoA dioxygenase family protein [Roseiflexaceae bacterium]|nr:phytanoyl-CoA dioxygenase family protein [Roseiflexaceae bacterium]
MTALTSEQVEQFQREGYLLVENLFDPAADIDPIIEEYHSVLERLAEEFYAQQRISSTYADLPFGRRLIEIYKESGAVQAQYFDFSLPQSDVREDTPLWVGPAVFATLRNEKLLDAVESIIGPEIYSNPVQHVRLKPPEHLTPKDAEGRIQLGKTPVHQDNGVVTPDADQTDMLTVWFPLWDATVKNGCLAVWPGSHRQGLLDHCPSHGGLRIPGKLLNGKAKSMPMKRGDALLMHKLTIHASHANHSDNIRWSFDLRYNPIGQPTGRSAFPGFVARSRKSPASELCDPAEWARLWHAARHALATEGMGPFNRWSADSPVCA